MTVIYFLVFFPHEVILEIKEHIFQVIVKNRRLRQGTENATAREMAKMTHFSNAWGESLTERVSRWEAEHKWCFIVRSWKMSFQTLRGILPGLSYCECNLLYVKRNWRLGDEWPFTVGRGGEQHFPGKVWLALACTRGARKADCVFADEDAPRGGMTKWGRLVLSLQ